MCISAYFVGVKHGKSMSKGNLPQSIIKTVTDPIKTIVKGEDVDLIQDGIKNIMAYDVDVALSHIKKQRG
jgi:hypothetical protein